MIASFDKAFNPTKKDKIRNYETLVELHRKYIGECCTCKFYSPPPSDLPGFVMDYGDCVLSKDIFSAKVCGLKDVECNCYEEDTSDLKDYLSEIERLQEINDEIRKRSKKDFCSITVE